MDAIRATIRLILFFMLTIALIPLQFLWLVFISKNIHVIPKFYHKTLRRIIGLTVQTEGHVADEPGTIFISNHISYLDIIAMASELRAAFVAKSEVASWPVFGLLAKLNNTVFIERTRRGIQSGSEMIEHAMQHGENLILFPEGTSNNGREVLPFKSGFFQVIAQSEHCNRVQPVTLHIVSVNEVKPEKQSDFDAYAWYGDMTLVPHLWSFFKLKGVTIQITYHPAIELSGQTDRKILAKKCEEAVSFPFKTLYDQKAVIHTGAP